MPSSTAPLAIGCSDRRRYSIRGLEKAFASSVDATFPALALLLSPILEPVKQGAARSGTGLRVGFSEAGGRCSGEQ